MAAKKSLAPQQTPQERRANIEKKMEEARAASPSGTLASSKGDVTVGASGVSGSYRATGGGTTQIVVEKETGKSAVVSSEQATGLTYNQEPQPQKTETITPTTREEFAQSLFAKQGKAYAENVRGEYVVAPQGAEINRSMISSAVEQRERKLYSTPETKEEKPVGSITEAKTGKVPLETRYADIAIREKGTVKGILIGTASIGIAGAKGVASGFVSVFKPSTYVQFGKAVFTKKGREEALEGIASIGSEIYAHPESGARMAGEFYGFGKGLKIGGKAVQLASKASPKYVSPTKAGVTIVEDVTIKTPINILKSYEGKTVPTVHATYSKAVKPGAIIEPQVEGASGWRKEVGQFSFYSSSPQEARITKLVGYTGKEIPAAYVETPIAPRYQPVVYGGYIGIGEGYSSSADVQLSLLPKAGRAVIFRETMIKETPPYVMRKTLPEVVKYHTVTPGTFVAAENIKEASVEGQFTTSPGLPGKPLIKIAEGEGELQGKFTYVNVKKPVPEFLGGEKSKLKTAWDFLTSENKKIKFTEAKFEEIKENVPEGKRISSKEISGSYGTKYKSSGAIIKKFPVSIVSSSRASASSSFSSISASKSSSISASSPSSLKSLSSSTSSIKSSGGSYSSPSSSSSVKTSSPSSFSYSRSSSSKASTFSSISGSYGSSKGSSITGMTVPRFTPDDFNRKESYGISRSFDVLLKKGKSFIKVGSGLPMGKALQLGSSKTLSNLRATFKLKEAGTTMAPDISFKPSSKLFREYKIVQGKPVPTPLTFIQRRSQRLVSSGERLELQSFRRLARGV